MRFDIWRLPIIGLAVTATAAVASEPMVAVKLGGSATKARDINGFVLGAPMKEAAKRLKISFVQGELVQASAGDFAYDFGVCPSGRIYRIESRQSLGRFIVDKRFTDQLGAKLVAKYGIADGGDPDNLGWHLIEPVRYTDGKVHLFKTNWASAIVTNYGDEGVMLELKMLDFRVCWAGKVERNVVPRDRASNRVKF